MKNIIIVMLISLFMGLVGLNSDIHLWIQVITLIVGTFSLGGIAIWELRKSRKESYDSYIYDQLKTIYYSSDGVFSPFPTKNNELEIKGRLSESDIIYATTKGYIGEDFSIYVR